MPGTLKLMSLRLINEKTPLFNLYSSSLWVFVPWWLNSYFIISYSNNKQPLANNNYAHYSNYEGTKLYKPLLAF